MEMPKALAIRVTTCLVSAVEFCGLGVVGVMFMFVNPRLGFIISVRGIRLILWGGVVVVVVAESNYKRKISKSVLKFSKFSVTER